MSSVALISPAANAGIPALQRPHAAAAAAPATGASLEPGKIHPSYLHANSTSHIWAFGAIAELLDNSQDASATHVDIDIILLQNKPLVQITDRGTKGMTKDHFHKVLSLGYNLKDGKTEAPIGQYGNGLKSGAMRLGKDALIISKNNTGYCLGFVSQNFHQIENRQEYVVPMLFFDNAGKLLGFPGEADNLATICKYSPFKTAAQLSAAFPKFKPHVCGTRIIISDLKMVDDSHYELDYTSDSKDIKIFSISKPAPRRRGRQGKPSGGSGDSSSSPPPMLNSLREYCKILYLNPKMIIRVRGSKVHTKHIKFSLRHTKTDTYRPNNSESNILRLQSYPITWGLNGSDTHFGLMLYHRGRLIMAYHRVGIQTKAHAQAAGVVGVVEADFLQPAHNKQGFLANNFSNAMKALSDKLKVYWEWAEPMVDEPDIVTGWVQCDACQKWRILPDGMDESTLPEKWYCRDNTWKPERASCHLPQDVEPKERKHGADEMAEIRKALKKKPATVKKERITAVGTGPSSPVPSTTSEGEDSADEEEEEADSVDEDIDLMAPEDSYSESEVSRAPTGNATAAIASQQAASDSVAEIHDRVQPIAQADDAMDVDQRNMENDVEQGTQLDHEEPSATQLDAAPTSSSSVEGGAAVDESDQIVLEFFEDGEQPMIQPNEAQQAVPEPENEPQRSQPKRKSSEMSAETAIFNHYTARFGGADKRRKLREESTTSATSVSQPIYTNDHVEPEATVRDEVVEAELQQEPAPELRAPVARARRASTPRVEKRAKRVVLEAEEEEEEADVEPDAATNRAVADRLYQLAAGIAKYTNELRRQKGKEAYPRLHMPRDPRALAELDVGAMLERLREAGK